MKIFLLKPILEIFEYLHIHLYLVSLLIKYPNVMI